MEKSLKYQSQIKLLNIPRQKLIKADCENINKQKNTFKNDRKFR